MTATDCAPVTCWPPSWPWKRKPYIRHATTRGDEVVFVLEDKAALGQVGSVLAAADIPLFELGRDTFDLRAYYRERLQEQRSRSAFANSDEAPPDSLQGDNLSSRPW